MPEFLTYVYLFYIFISLYFLSLYVLIFFPNRKNFFDFPKPEKKYTVDIVVPCYNEGESIGDTVRSILNSGYKNLGKVIVVDDCSKDNSFQIIKELEKKYKKVIALKTPKNTGCAAGSKNYGARFSKSELIGFSDGDSFINKDSINKMVGFFNDETVAAVTPMILVHNKDSFFSRVQAVEYRVISFTRKLLGYIGGIYVTPGPLAIYRREYFDKVGGFDEKNLTEDIEITWNLVAYGYRVEMSSQSVATTIVPKKFRAWFAQRVRWNLGGIQTILKHRKAFLHRGMLGSFILPFFVFSWILGVAGLMILAYRSARGFIVRYLSTYFSVQTQTAVLTSQDINLIPSVLVFFGVVLFFIGLIFTGVALKYSREKGFKTGLFTLLLFMFVYLLTFPVLIIVSLYRYARGKKKW